MPKQFGHTVCSIATVLVAFSFVGCRTTTSKLASVPGLSWLERGEEGWAKYEPAPGLPRPSSTSEPTSAGNSATNIASTTEDGSGTGSSFDGGSTPKVASKDRFDKSYLGSSTRTNTASNYGDYASAYGKYGPPKPLAKDSTIAPQKGPYDVDTPKYASYGSGGSTSGYGESDGSRYADRKSPKTDSSATNAKSTDRPYSYAANNQFGNPPPSSGTDPAAKELQTASSTSKFGGSVYSKPKTSTYTPPGFAKSSSKPAPQTGSRFGDLQTTAQSAQQKASSLLSSANQQLKSTAQGGFTPSSQAPNQFVDAARNTTKSYAETAANAIQSTTQSASNQSPKPFAPFADAAAQTANQIAKSTQQVAGGYASAATEKLQSTAQNVKGQAGQLINRYADSVSQTASNHLGAAEKQLQSTSNAATAKFNNTLNSLGSSGTTASGAGSQSASNSNPFQKAIGGVAQGIQQQPNPIQNFAQQAKTSLEQSANSRFEQVKSSLGQYADSTLDGVKAEAANVANTITSSDTYTGAVETANRYLNTAESTLAQTREAVQGYTPIEAPGRNVMQNVSAPMQSTYPATNTPNPFVVPGSSISRSKASPPTTFAPQRSNNTAPATVPSMQRSTAPFRPGSTSTFQGATRTNKPSFELVSSNSSRRDESDHVVLAVGDKYQFPRTLR